MNYLRQIKELVNEIIPNSQVFPNFVGYSLSVFHSLEDNMSKLVLKQREAALDAAQERHQSQQ